MKKSCKNGLQLFKKMSYTPPKKFPANAAKKIVFILKKAFLYIFYVTLRSPHVKKKFFPKSLLVRFFRAIC